MTRVAPFAQQELILFHTLNLQGRLSDRQLQLSTGKVAEQYSGIASQAGRLLSIEADRARTVQFRNNIDAFAHRLSLADIALSTIDDGVRDLRTTFATVINFPDAHSSDLRQSAADMRDLVRDMLNSQDGGRYIFAGTRTDHRPVSLDPPAYAPVNLIEAGGNVVDESAYQSYYTGTLGNALPYAQGSFYAQIFFEKNGVAPAGPLPADPDNPTLAEFAAEDPDLFQFYVDRLDAAATLGAPKLDYYNGDQGYQSVRADESLEMTLPVRADDTALAQIIAALDAVANLPDDQPDLAEERAIVVKAQAMLSAALGSDASSGYPSLAALRTSTASVLSRLSATSDRHANFSAYAEGTIGDIENINEAEVITRLQHDRFALEAAYSTMAELQSMSLLNYL